MAMARPVAVLLVQLVALAVVRAPAGPAYPAGTTAKRKCESWGRLVQAEEATRRGEAPAPGYAQCFSDLPVLPIVGGNEALLFEFPHMAAVGFGESHNKRWLCGGSLISENYVLTAAHCVEDKSTPGRRGVGPARWVRLGDLDLSTPLDDEWVQELAVAEGLAHPGYRADVKYFDVGLLRLERPVTFGSAVRPACLHTLIDPLPATASATGWGRLDENGPLADRLQRVDLPLVPQDTCRRLFEPVGDEGYSYELPAGIVGGMVCAGGEAGGGRDACAGDSGGPLQTLLPAGPRCVHAVLGVTSFGKGCARPGLPGVYARVAEFVPWIESVVWPEDVAALADDQPILEEPEPEPFKPSTVTVITHDDDRLTEDEPHSEPKPELSFGRIMMTQDVAQDESLPVQQLGPEPLKRSVVVSHNDDIPEKTEPHPDSKPAPFFRRITSPQDIAQDHNLVMPQQELFKGSVVVSHDDDRPAEVESHLEPVLEPFFSRFPWTQGIAQDDRLAELELEQESFKEGVEVAHDDYRPEKVELHPVPKQESFFGEITWPEALELFD